MEVSCAHELNALAGSAESRNAGLSPRVVEVASAALFRRVEGRVEILIARRHAHAVRGGLWELPGGKIEGGEAAEQAALREVREEVGLESGSFLSRPTPLVVVEQSDPDVAREKSIRLHAFLAEVKPDASPRALGASEVRWVGIHELSGFEWPKANARVNEAIVRAFA